LIGVVAPSARQQQCCARFIPIVCGFFLCESCYEPLLLANRSRPIAIDVNNDDLTRRHIPFIGL
jgi:hypothetical protein